MLDNCKSGHKKRLNTGVAPVLILIKEKIGTMKNQSTVDKKERKFLGSCVAQGKKQTLG